MILCYYMEWHSLCMGWWMCSDDLGFRERMIRFLLRGTTFMLIIEGTSGQIFYLHLIQIWRIKLHHASCMDVIQFLNGEFAAMQLKLEIHRKWLHYHCSHLLSVLEVTKKKIIFIRHIVKKASDINPSDEWELKKNPIFSQKHCFQCHKALFD